MEVRVTAPGGAIDAAFLAGLIGAFNAAHPENLRLQLCRAAEDRTGQSVRLRFRPDRAAANAETRRRDGKPAPKSSRAVYFGSAFGHAGL
jgi:hypothetical protein